MANGSKYVDYVCGRCNIADDIEIRGQVDLNYAGLTGDAAVMHLRGTCCGMPCKYYIMNTYGFPMLHMDYQFWRTNGRLPTPDDREKLMNLKKGRARKENTEVDLTDFLDEEGNVWGYEPDSEVKVHSESHITLLPPTDDAVESEDNSRWAQVKTKTKRDKAGRPPVIEFEIDEDFEL